MLQHTETTSCTIKKLKVLLGYRQQTGYSIRCPCNTKKPSADGGSLIEESPARGLASIATSNNISDPAASVLAWTQNKTDIKRPLGS